MDLDQRKRHVCHVTTVHPWSDTRIFERMCVGLRELGYQVTLVAPVGEPFEERGVAVVPTGLSGKAARVLGGRSLLRRLQALGADIYHFHDPELLPWMAYLRRSTGHHVVYDVHEFYPQSALDSNYFGWRVLSRVGGSIFGVIEPVLGRTLDAVVGVTPPITQRFAGGTAQLLTVRNFPKVEEMTLPSTVVQLPSSRTLVVGGVVDDNRLGLEMIDALALLAARWSDLHLLHIGNLTNDPYGNRLRARAAEHGIGDRVLFRPRLPWAALQAHLAASIAGLVLLRDNEGCRYALPTRLTEFMAQGVPVIATGSPLLRDIVQQADCGLLLSDGSAGSIADAIEHILLHPEQAKVMGTRGREAVRQRFNWNTELMALDALYDRL